MADFYKELVGVFSAAIQRDSPTFYCTNHALAISLKSPFFHFDGWCHPCITITNKL